MISLSITKRENRGSSLPSSPSSSSLAPSASSTSFSFYRGLCSGSGTELVCNADNPHRAFDNAVSQSVSSSVSDAGGRRNGRAGGRAGEQSVQWPSIDLGVHSFVSERGVLE